MSAREASYYERGKDSSVLCRLCPHACVIKPDRCGICQVRRNEGGVLYTDIYGEVSSIAMDPVEKKPLYHYYPGKMIFSIGTKGCNLKCPYCQNWQISQNPRARTRNYSPKDIVDLALQEKTFGIAYTYSEPLVWIEFVKDTSTVAHASGMKNVLVTNGYVNPAPLNDLTGLVDAMNIDLKSFNEDTYRRVQKGDLKTVMRTIEKAHGAGIHIELTTLIITGLNDNLDEMMQIVSFISSIDKNIPWHISRYYPNYEYDKQPTDINFIRRVYEQAADRLDFVYTGNLPYENIGSDTRCPHCGALLVSRNGYRVKIENLKGRTCGQCGAADLHIFA